MAEPKTRPTDASVEDFLAAVEPAGKREDARAVCALMAEITGKPAVMWGPAIVGFGRYTNPTKPPADWPVLGFSPRKATLTLYVMDGFSQRPDLAARLGPKAKTSVACLYLKRLADVEPDLLREICEWSMKTTKSRHPTNL